MDHVPPRGSRILSLFRNRAGVSVGYEEIVTVLIPPNVGETHMILAAFHPGGSVTGMWTDISVRMPADGIANLDTARLRRAREHAESHTDKRALTPAEQQRVRAVAAWVGPAG
jgi:hypothetical protein